MPPRLASTPSRRRGRARALVATLGCALMAPLVLPGVAGAHSLVRPASGIISYLSQDATSLNTLIVDTEGSRIAFRDRTADGGMDPGGCEPGEVSSGAGYILEAFCPGSGVRRVRVELGEREDSARIVASVAAVVLGGPGADAISGGPLADELAGETGDDNLQGGAGDDILDGGLGADRAAGGPGDDTLRMRDGIADEVSCGDGLDTVLADTVDSVAADCEQVTRVATEPPPGAAELGRDKVAPRVRAGGDRTQRIGGSRRTIRLVAASSEAGSLATSGVLNAGGLRLPLVGARAKVRVAGGGVALRFTLSSLERREALRALRARRSVRVSLSVVGTDAAGNSRVVRLPSIRLTR